jgi:hypothetical protein
MMREKVKVLGDIGTAFASKDCTNYTRDGQLHWNFEKRKWDSV